MRERAREGFCWRCWCTRKTTKHIPESDCECESDSDCDIDRDADMEGVSVNVNVIVEESCDPTDAALSRSRNRDGRRDPATSRRLTLVRDEKDINASSAAVLELYLQCS